MVFFRTKLGKILIRQKCSGTWESEFNGEPLKFNNELKYFGVTIDNKLTWYQHIENIENKINKGIAALKKCVTFYRKIHLPAFLMLL